MRRLQNQKQGVIESSHSSSNDSDDEGDDESEEIASDSFVDDDGDGHVELPQQFSNNALQTPHFKFKVTFHYVLLLVMRGAQVLPLRGADADYFVPPLRFWRRRMADFRDSRVRGQIWKPSLVRKLDTRPSFVAKRLEFPVDSCAACNRRGRISTFVITLEGDAYNRENYEPLTDNESRPKELNMGERTGSLQYTHERELLQASHRSVS